MVSPCLICYIFRAGSMIKTGSSWSCASRRKLPPVKAQFDEKQRSESKGDDTHRREAVAQMTPVPRPQIEHSARDKRKRHRIRTSHPLAMLDELPIARGDECGDGADDPRCRLHRSSRQTGPACCQRDPSKGADKHRNDVHTAQHTMEFEIALAKPR